MKSIKEIKDAREWLVQAIDHEDDPDQVRGLKRVMKLLDETNSGYLECLQLRPSDIIILNLTKEMTWSNVEDIRNQIEMAFPDNTFVILGNGIQMSVCRAELTTTRFVHICHV